MNDIFKNIQNLWQTISESVSNLFHEPVFWLILFLFCVVLFMNAKTKSKSAYSQRTFAKGIQKLINTLINIFLDLFNSIFDAIGVILNFIKELSSLLFGSLHEARANRLAAFGVIFLSGVSFYTTGNGLYSFVGFPYNWLVSFGIQSAILIVDYKIIKDFKQRKEIKKQIIKKQVDNKELNSDSFFSWSNSLKVRFKRCLDRADKIQKIILKKAPNNNEIIDKSKQLVDFFKIDSEILALFDDTIVKSQLSTDMNELFTKMEDAANCSQRKNEARRNTVDLWIVEKFNNIKQEIDEIITPDPEAQKNLNPLLNDISRQLNEIKSNWQKFIMMPKIIYREGSTWVTRIWNNEKTYKNVEAYRYSSGKIQEFYKRGHFFGLALVLALFIFLSSTFSFSYIYNTNFKDKQDIENYHMTVKMCDDAIMNYKKNISTISNISKDKLNKFIQEIQESDAYNSSSIAYTNYYSDEKKIFDINDKIEKLDDNDPNYYVLLSRNRDDLQTVEKSKAENEKKKVLYQEYLAFIEIFSQTPFSKEILTGKSAPTPPASDDEGYLQKLKEYDLASTIWTNKGLVTTTENIIAKLSLYNDSNENWLEIREQALIYQKICDSLNDLLKYQKDKQDILENDSDRENVKSEKLLKKTTEFTDKILSTFTSINQDNVVSFCDSMYSIKNNISDQERFISEQTAEVEKARTMLFSRFVPTGMPLFCWFIAVLIDSSIFVILFIRGIKNRAHILDKQKVLLAKLLLKNEDEKKESISQLHRSIIIICALLLSIVLTFLVDIPYISSNREWMFFVIWFALYIIASSIVRLIRGNDSPIIDKSFSAYKRKNMLVDDYYTNLMGLLERDFGNNNALINHCEKYRTLLINEFPEYKLHITDDFRVLKDNISRQHFSNVDDMNKYVSNLQFDLMYRIQNSTLENYFNDMCSDFLKLLEPSDSKEYGGFNYLFHKALDKCNDREQLFSIFYESLYPTLLYIPYETAVKKGLHVFLKILIGEELAYLDNGNVYISPLFFRILDEILYMKMLDDDFDFTNGDDIDTDLGMDDVVEAYIEAKYLNIQE